MLNNQIHSADIRQVVVKTKCVMYFDPDARVFFLAIDTRCNFCDKFSSAVLSV